MKQNSQHLSNTLLTHQIEENSESLKRSPINKNLIIALAIIVIVALIVITVILSVTLNKNVVPPSAIKLPLLDDHPMVMKLGTSRVLEVLFFSGNDDRTSDDFKVVTEKTVHWRVDPEGIISIDDYGRVEALSQGTATIKVASVYSNSVSDSKKIQVVANQKMISDNKRVVDYSGPPEKVPSNFQKTVDRYTKSEVAQNDKIPKSIKDLSADPTNPNKTTSISKDNIKWQILQYTDKTKRSYIKRTDNSIDGRDKYQYFIGNRYLPGSGMNVLSIADDNNNGIWTVQENGTVTNIKMNLMTCNQKSEKMVVDTEQNVMRHGFASDAQLKNLKWIPSVSDNDGLWTAMFGAGELMKYSSLKRQKAAQEQIQKARDRAVKSLKAVLMNAVVAGRNGTVDARIRRFNSSRQEVFLSQEYLKKNKQYKIQNYPNSPADGVGFFGQHAGMTVDGAFEGGTERYTYQPLNPDDWGTSGQAATSKRTLNGYLARTFIIPALEGDEASKSGLFFKRNQNGTQTVVSGANMLYDYSAQDHPVLNLGNLQLPQILASIETIDGNPLKGSDLMYKGDTSTDSLIGHLFIYKIAFDILDVNDNTQKQLKQLIADIIVNLAQMFINNGYIHVDATGQGTKWARMTRDFFNSDYTLEDSPLKALQTLLIFKLCYYITGDAQWNDQYLLLVNHQSFKYADLVSTLWDRWVWRAFNQDADPESNSYRLNFSQSQISETQLVRHIMYNDHYSDDQEALLAYYLIFQLEQDQNLLNKYKKGLNGYWQTIKRSENPLWYLIYQLSDPNNTSINDHFGNNILKVSAWSLSRHPIDTVTYIAFVQGSRPDVIFQGILSANPQVVIGTRKSVLDAKLVNVSKNYQIFDYDPMNIYEIKPLPQDQRSMHKYNGPTFTNIDRGNSNNKEAATLFTLPYWLGVYHKMIVFDD